MLSMQSSVGLILNSPLQEPAKSESSTGAHSAAPHDDVIADDSKEKEVLLSE